MDMPLKLPTFSNREPAIIYHWLAVLRWLAVVGQVGAVVVAVWGLGLSLPLGAVFGVVSVTLVTNVGLTVYLRYGRPAARWLPGVLMLDVVLLSVLLGLTGGPANPFCSLYLVNVALSVVVLGAGWAAVTAGLAVVGYGVLFWVSRRLDMSGLEPWVGQLGQWVSMALVAGLITYFIGRVSGELRRREAELSEVRERNARNEQLAALTTLAAGAAHELGSPLGTIAVAAKELERSARIGLSGHPAGAGMAEDATLIRQEVERCRKIINRMRIDVGSEASRRPTVMAAADFVGLVLEDLRDDERGRVAVDVAADCRVINVPVRNVQQAMVVLLKNAFDAGGTAVKMQVGRRARAAGGQKGAGAELVFAVEDDGPGMTDEVMRRAGQPFFTTKDVGKGMGLGLFLVRLIAETYKGQLTLARLPLGGTRAELTIEEQPFRTEEISYELRTILQSDSGDGRDVRASAEPHGGGRGGRRGERAGGADEHAGQRKDCGEPVG
jgi:two-component system sensor histidine kinase RegB